MSRLRIISVWVVAICAILIVYRVYNRVSDTPVIEPPGSPSAHDLPEPVFNDGPSIAGTTTVGQAENARYTFVDDLTKKVTRVFGFEKLLNPEAGTRKWNLQKPFISMYEKTFDCDITADRGALTVETVKGSPSPTDGQLYENVVIRIRAADSAGPVESVLYMDQLNYNSERSEFSTEGPVRLVSPRADMQGRGMLLIYNPAMNRIEFLKVIHLDYLKLKNIESFSSRTAEHGEASTQADASASTEKSAIASAAKPPAAAPATPNSGEKAPKPSDKPIAAPVSADDLYMCTFSRDVVIKYGGEVTVEGAQEVLIDNILWARSGSDKDPTPPKTPAQDKAASKAAPAPAAGNVPSDSGPAKADMLPPDTAPAEPKPPLDVHITCKGGFMAKPLTSVFEAVEPSLTRQPSGMPFPASAAAANTPAASASDVTPADRATSERAMAAVSPAAPEGGAAPELSGLAEFKARRITYDMTTGYGLAQGPVALTFQPAPDPNDDPNATVLPMVLTAEKNAEFFAGAERAIEKIVFNQNVVGTRKVLTPEYIETSSFYGQTLTTNLETDRQSERSGQINDIAVTEGNVKLESIRTNHDEDVISHVRLVCLRVDYDAAKAIVYATGPGNIQLNNQNAPPPPADSQGKKLSLSGPCWALVQGFDRLTWFTEAMQINADGKENAVNLSYQPIENGKPGQIVRGSTAHLQANFWPLPDGGSELATVITAGGIYFAEDGGNVFMGEDLLYDAENGLLTISSSERNACLLNGALVDRIEYEVNTGKVRSNLASSPGAVTVPVKP